MRDLNIANVVGGGDLNREFDLPKLYSDFPREEVRYEPEFFSALIIDYHSPKATVMLYSSGKYSLAGAKSKQDAVEASQILKEDIEHLLGEGLMNTDFEIRYLVCTGDLGYSVDLQEIMLQLGLENTEYEPEQFPGLFYYPPTKDWFSMIFSSGKVVIDGAGDKEDLEFGFNWLEEQLDVE